MDYEQILYDKRDGIATVTLNRPEKLNAFTEQMRAEICDALDRVDEDDDVRVVIFTGMGRAYCAGADLSGGGATFDARGREGAAQEWEKARDGGGLLTLRLYECKKPIIAAINGPAVGVGITQTLAMDIRLASETARFGFVFARRGLVPEACSSWFLPRAVGIQKAAEWVFSGRVFPVEEALAAGLVRSVHPVDQLLPAAIAIAEEIRDNTAPVAVALSRQMLWRMLGERHPMAAHRIDSPGIFFLGQSDDAREGVGSFLDKRAPAFPGKVSKDMPPHFPWWKDEAFR
ncbi:MAG: crotonase/enoyl-CoA hydratase family protein [Dehalococcoidia bacterium]